MGETFIAAPFSHSISAQVGNFQELDGATLTIKFLSKSIKEVRHTLYVLYNICIYTHYICKATVS